MNPPTLLDLIAEPRTITATQTSVYATLWVAGLVAVVDSPEVSVAVAGSLMTDVWGWLTMLSCVIAGLGCVPGIWWMERAGVYGMQTACVMQMVIISRGYLAGSALWLHGAFVVAVAALLAARLMRIRMADLDPARRPSDRFTRNR